MGGKAAQGFTSVVADSFHRRLDAYFAASMTGTP